MIADIEQLLYREADLLDSGQFHQWLELLAPDVRYWAPVRCDVARASERANETNRLPLFDETRESLMLRVQRLDTGLAWSEIPATRTRRMIGNVRCDDLGAGRIRVFSNFLLFRSRSPIDETLMSGAREDVWSQPGQWLLRERKITIDHRVVENMSLFL
jgi:3-phenylpropionate/cinnamic acid dioxygenase small subunit